MGDDDGVLAGEAASSRTRKRESPRHQAARQASPRLSSDQSTPARADAEATPPPSGGVQPEVECPECPVCYEFYIEPLKLQCGHAFCRLCLLQSTRLAPDGRACPLCRSPVDILEPLTHPVCIELEQEVRSAVPAELFEARSAASKVSLEELASRSGAELPIFFMYPGTKVGERVALHFFEPRYKVMIRRAWEGNRQFIFCSERPRSGARGVLMHVEQVRFAADGQADMVAYGAEAVSLGDTWVDEAAGGLFYTKLTSGTLSAGLPAGDEAEEVVFTPPSLSGLIRRWFHAILARDDGSAQAISEALGGALGSIHVNGVTITLEARAGGEAPQPEPQAEASPEGVQSGGGAAATPTVDMENRSEEDE